MRRLIALALVLTIGATATGTATATAAEPRTSLPDVEDEVMCTTCNVPLNIAESPQADQQRAVIRRLVDRGLTKDEVKAALVDEYGTDVLALPEEEGVNLAVYVVPVLLVLLMVGGAVVALPRWRRRAQAPAAGPAPAGGPATDAELRRLDEDLARYE